MWIWLEPLDSHKTSDILLTRIWTRNASRRKDVTKFKRTASNKVRSLVSQCLVTQSLTADVKKNTLIRHCQSLAQPVQTSCWSSIAKISHPLNRFSGFIRLKRKRCKRRLDLLSERINLWLAIQILPNRIQSLNLKHTEEFQREHKPLEKHRKLFGSRL